VKRIATTLLVAGFIAASMLALPPAATAAVSVGISIDMAPPPLPVYAQPVVPGPGYLWSPGYWAWAPAYGYYWVPGTWVMPPAVGLLWTPGWWGWSSGLYRWHPGYWGARVGFYGGINYGFGYFGTGYVGGYWRGRAFHYNRAVNNVNITNIRNVYVNNTVIDNVRVNRVSYNGGRDGIVARPSAAQRTIVNQRRWSATPGQARQREAAMRNPSQRFQNNHGRPALFATQRAGRFDGPHAVRAPGSAHRDWRPAPHPPHEVVEAPRERAPSLRPQRPFREAPASDRGYAEARPARQREFNRRATVPHEKRGGNPRHEKPDHHRHR
jgi:hypothetical protein